MRIDRSPPRACAVELQQEEQASQPCNSVSNLAYARGMISPPVLPNAGKRHPTSSLLKNSNRELKANRQGRPDKERRGKQRNAKSFVFERMKLLIYPLRHLACLPAPNDVGSGAVRFSAASQTHLTTHLCGNVNDGQSCKADGLSNLTLKGSDI